MISAGNYYGAIIDRNSVNPPALNGNGAVRSLGTTDPSANFSD